MSETTIAQTQTGRHELGQHWHRKGFFWAVPTVGGMAPVASLGLANSSIADAFWSGVLIGVQHSLLLAQVGAFTRMCVCYRRATKIWKGEVSS